MTQWDALNDCTLQEMSEVPFSEYCYLQELSEVPFSEYCYLQELGEIQLALYEFINASDSDICSGSKFRCGWVAELGGILPGPLSSWTRPA